MTQPKHPYKSRFSPLFRGIALFLVVSFSLHDVSYAAPALELSFFSRDIVQNPGLIKISPAFGKITDVHKGKTRLLIHIQDAHTNLSAQENISKALEELIQRHKIKTVFVEGGTKDDSLNFLRPLASKDIRERVAKKYLVRGELKGVEYLNLSSDYDMELLGVEDPELYDKNLRTYGRVVSKREEVVSYVEEIQKRVQTLKSHLYPKDLLALDEFIQKFEKKEKDFSEYHEVLSSAADRAGIGLFNYPNFLSLRDLKAREEKIDFKKANEEQASLIQTVFQDAVEREEAQEFFSKEVSKLKAGSVAPFSFYRALIEKAKKAGIQEESFANLKRYADYLELYGKVDLSQLFKETKALETEIYQKSLTSTDSIYLHDIADYLDAVKNLFSLQISKEDFDAYAAKSSDVRFETIVLLAFLNKKLYELGYTGDVARYLPLISDNRYDVESFYRTNEKRDEAFLDKALRKMEKDDIPAAVIITGGYHTPHLTRLMKEHNLSYAVVSPNISQETNLKRYEEKLFGQKLNLAPASVKAGQKAEITLRFKLVKGFAITTMPPMTLKLQPPAGVKLEKSEFTTPDKDPKSKDEYYVDLPEIKIPATASAAGTYTIPGQLTYFFCSKDEGFCSKQTLDVKVPFKAE